MSVAELFYRLGETVKRRWDRFQCYCLPVSNSINALPIIPELRERLLQWRVPPALLAEWRQDATQAQAGQFFLLGQRWPDCPPSQKWHIDPATGKYWPKDRFCFAIDFRHATGWGDVKYVWELNRLQYLQPIAALACMQQDAALACWCLEEIDSWITHNPPFFGINWASGIELALRAVSMIVVTTLVGEQATPAQRLAIQNTLHTHARWLARYPSAYSSANNHRTAEGLGLLLIGVLCPHFRAAEHWRNQGWKILCETARLQILPDGVGAEQTPNYTAVVLEMLLLGLHIARAQQLAVPDYYEERIALAGEYLRWFTDEGGNQPRIGDDDNARVLGVYRQEEQYVRAILGCIAALTQRPDLTPPNDSPHLRTVLFGSPPIAGAGPLGVRLFPDGGYTVGRYETSAGNMLLAMDHGYLGYLSIAAHGHADALALWLHIGDQPVLVDSGTYLYHSGGKWRDYFRGTRAHNTLCIDGHDSSTRSGHFNWSHKANVQLLGHGVEADHWWVEAEHDGYAKKFAVRHRRRLDVTAANGFRVEDSLIGSGTHSVAVGFLLHPALRAYQEASAIFICKEKQILLQISHEGGLKSAIHAANTPGCGWYSPTFGEKEPATRIDFSGMLAAGQKAITHFTFSASHD